MSLLKTLEEAELAFAINYFTASDLIAAVEELLDATPELWGVEELAELVWLNRQQKPAVHRAPDLLRSYLAANPMRHDLRPRSLEACGRALLKARLEHYIDSEDLPVTVCRMVYAIEQKFDYPEWLGDLYNVCDWSEDASTREEFPAVRQEAERLVKVL